MKRTSIFLGTATALPVLFTLLSSAAPSSTTTGALGASGSSAAVSSPSTGASSTSSPSSSATSSSTTTASTAGAVAKALVDDLGVFELDGNCVDDPAGPPCSPTSGIDWLTVDFTQPNTAQVCDPLTNDDIFTGGGSKDIQNLDQWACTTGTVPDKDDLLRAGVYATVVPADNCGSTHNAPGDKLLYFFADRFANNGDAQLGFWFFQNKVVHNPVTGKFEDGAGNPASHRDGDLLILAHFVNGGASTDPLVLKWQLGAPNNLVNVTPTPFICGLNPDPEVCLVANPDNTPNCQNTVAPQFGCAQPYTPKFNGNCPASGFYPNVSFFEGGINLTVLVPDVCCFTSFLVETRSSQSLDAVLKDFLLGQIATCDLEITQTCTGGCVGGTGIVFSGTVTNSGFTPLTNVVVHNTACGNVTIGSLAPGASHAWSCTAACAAGPVTNTSFATGDPGVNCGTVVTSDSVMSTCSCDTASLTVSQTCTPGCDGGTGVIFTVTVTNNGTVPLTGVVIHNTNATCGDVTVGALAAGASATRTCQVACASTSISNTASASGTAAPPCASSVTSNSDSDTCACSTAGLTVSQTCTPGCDGGTGVIFTVTVTNSGNVALTNVVIHNTNATCGDVTVGALAAGASATRTCQVACAGASISNTASASGTAAAPCASAVTSNSDSDTCACSTTGLTVSQTCTPGCDGGTGVIFTVTVTNSGNVALTNVVIHNTNATCGDVTIGALAAGASATRTCQVACASASISNTASASGTAAAPCASSVTSNSDSDTCACSTTGLTVSQTCTPGCDGGTGVIFTVTVTNSGNVALTNVVIHNTNATCGDVTVGALAAGASATRTCQVACAGASISNTASASGTAAAPCASSVTSNSDSDTCACSTASLTVSQTCTPGCDGGTGVIFTVTVTNNGNVPLTGVVIHNTNATCGDVTIGALAAGASATRTCEVACAGASISNTASASGTAAAPCASSVTSNSDSDTCACSTASLHVSQTCTAGCDGGTGVIFTVTVTNNGNVALTGVVLHNTNATCGDVTIGALAAGASATRTCEVACASAPISNTASATGTAAAPCAPAVTSNSDSDTCSCTGASLLVSQTCATGCDGGTGVVFTVTVTNNGAVPLTGVVLHNTNATCGDVTIGALAVGASATRTCEVACASAPISNSVSATGTAGAPCAASVTSNTDSDTCSCVRAGLTVSQTCTPGCDGGTGVIFTVTVTNNGTVPLTGVVIHNTNATCGDVSIGALAAGASATRTCQVACAGASISNTASASGTAAAPCVTAVTSNSDSDTCACSTTGLTVSQTCTPGCDGGTGVIFTVTVTNSGNVALTNVVLHNTNATCGDVTIGALAAGASATRTCEVACSSNPISNTASATGTAAAPCASSVTSNTDSDTCSCSTTGLQVSQTCATGCNGGTGVIFTVTVTNSGNVALTNVVIHNTNATCGDVTIGALAAGASATRTCEVACSGSPISNTASATGNAAAPCATSVTSNSDADTCDCLVACLSISESCTPPGTCGNVIVFSGTVTNCGTVDLTNVVVTGNLCSPAAIGNLAAGASVSWSCNFTAPLGGSTNMVSATGNASAPCAGTITSDTASSTCSVAACGQGCTPGYWKNHTSRWDSPSDPIAAAAGFTTSTDFYTFFGLPPGVCGLPLSLTMVQACALGGGGPFKLARHGVPGLLNYAAGLAYSVPGTNITNAAQLRTAIRDAYLNNCTVEPLATQIAAGNEAGTCPLN